MEAPEQWGEHAIPILIALELAFSIPQGPALPLPAMRACRKISMMLYPKHEALFLEKPRLGWRL